MIMVAIALYSDSMVIITIVLTILQSTKGSALRGGFSCFEKKKEEENEEKI